MDELTAKIRSSGNNRIWLPGEEPLELAKVKTRYSNLPVFVDGWTTDGLPEGLARRQDPFSGQPGKVDLRDACTDAVIQSMLYGVGHYKSAPEYLFHFLNPATNGLSTAPYQEKLTVVPKILEEFFHIHYGGHHRATYAGNIPDPTSGFMNVDPAATDFFWLECDVHSDNYEVLFNTKESDTTFLIKCLYGFGEEKHQFAELQKRHEKENIFANGPVNFVKHVGMGWHIPILGVTRIVGLIGEPRRMVAEITLDKNGVTAKDFDFPGFEKYWLLPEGYWTRNR